MQTQAVLQCVFHAFSMNGKLTAPWLEGPVPFSFSEHNSYIHDRRLCGSPCGDVLVMYLSSSFSAGKAVDFSHNL